MNEGLLRRKAVEERLGLSRSTIYAAMQKGEFPRPLRIGKRAVAWECSKIEEWLSARPQGGSWTS